MNAWVRHLVMAPLFAGALWIGLTMLPGCKTAEPKQEAAKTTAPATQIAQPAEQTVCPVMGGAINKAIFTDYKGKKVYFCCAGCEKRFLSSPETYVSKLPQFAK